jgi:5-(carboxyamino)imidazole ribonucleotide synthase
MFAAAARRMGYRLAVWDPDPDAPAHSIADISCVSPFSDEHTREQFANHVHGVTLEWENIPAELCEWLANRLPVRPAGAVLRTIQNRITQKTFLQGHQLPVPPFVPVHTPDRLMEAVAHIGLPAVCKTATSGYDGKGQWLIRRRSDIEAVGKEMQAGWKQGAQWILERFVEFERELSVLVVRAETGECRAYPVVENIHEGGILRMTLVPSSIPAPVALDASELARHAVESLGGVGVFCVELFHTAEGLFINEVAPRPHNSGHYTLDACTVSQFEQQVRVLCGLPLGEARLVSPAAMVNLIGTEVTTVTCGEGYRELLAIPGAVLHLYGKRVVRTGRKMGHVTFVTEKHAEAVQQAHWLMRKLTSSR